MRAHGEALTSVDYAQQERADLSKTQHRVYVKLVVALLDAVAPAPDDAKARAQLKERLLPLLTDVLQVKKFLSRVGKSKV